MTPGDLFDLCMDAIDRFNRGEVSAAEPFIMLTLPRKVPLRGDRIRLFGKSGPFGRVATGKPRDDGLWNIVAYFPAVAVVKALSDMMGVKVAIQRGRPPDG
ncbi:hypothetical protein [Sphingopyxis macrogoltabida]|uniref:Uncharacterized protein n=1 Tax=Sphingopyxis macrogoltabida TaxID=33050 RepID=A0A0N9V3R3_SPHMC|nr:hypothetical protein [Sphingopyxis macrogoltabida]ALH82948.1 hypothetical protein AN936_22095 [Sphingopyxis macrogoltabida]